MDNQFQNQFQQNQFHYIIAPQPMVASDGLVGIAGMRRLEMQHLGPQIHQYSQPKGVFSRLKDALLNLVTEEVETSASQPSAPGADDRPIGLSQLSRQTFQASHTAGQTIFKRGRVLNDYRFSQLVDRQGY